MLTNPLADSKPLPREMVRYPYRIVCVYEDSDNNDFPIIRDVRAYCAENGFVFVNRQYDIDKYSEDMNIHRLPAFHVYLKGCVQETHYYDQDPVYKIQIISWAYQDELRAKERARLRRQERWDALTETLYSIADMFRRKPALDRESSLSHTRSNNTGGTPSAAPSIQRRRPQRESAPG